MRSPLSYTSGAGVYLSCQYIREVKRIETDKQENP